MTHSDETRPTSPTGNEGALLEVLFAEHRERLRVMVHLRTDGRLRARFDASDVIQEAFLEATQRYAEYVKKPALSPYLWLRFLTLQRLLIFRRRHSQAQARDAWREVPLDGLAGPQVSAANLAACIVESGTSPSQAAARAELQARLQRGLEQMDEADREILVLRHFEQLSNAEAAATLGLNPGTASQRYYRALKRLKDVLEALGGISWP